MKRATVLRAFRRFLFCVAWAGLLTSLVLPALAEPTFEAMVFFRLPYTPVGVMLFCAESWGATALEWVLFPALAAFVIAPVLLLGRLPLVVDILRRVLSAALLLVWLVPVLWLKYLQASNRLGSMPTWRHLEVGYYVYAAAHTLAFVACWLGPYGRPSHRPGGFPVVAPPDTQSQPSGPRRS